MSTDYRLAFAVISVALLAGCSEKPAGTAVPAAGGGPTSADWFTDVAQASGLDFTHVNGMSGRFYYPEIMAPGVALFDYDNDGDLDVYVTQGQMLGVPAAAGSGASPSASVSHVNKDRLFRNDLVTNADGTHTLHFTDVTEQSKIDLESYGMGVATGDFNNDGYVDIYRTGLSGAVMLRNNKDGTFTDVTKATGTSDPGGWGVSATFFDYDRDGWLDLFVGNYLIYSLGGDVPCQSVTGRRDYCPPNSYRAQPSRLFHNRGNGTFEDVTAKAFVNGAYGPALGASTADFNRDGWIDLYVANDGQPNQLWINQHNGTFKDAAFLAGAAVSGTGQAEASMGVDAGDFDNDGDEDLFITNWLDQMNVLYVNDGSGNFEDRRAASGLGPPSLAKTGFGAGWFDFDRDGWLDLFVANGGVATIEALARANDPFPLRMTPQLYRNLGTGRFEDVSSRAGAVFKIADVGRGVAFGDVDNDGSTDVLVGNANGRLRLLVNHEPNRNHWLGLRLVSDVGRAFQARLRGPERAALRADESGAALRDQLGAVVEVVRSAGPALWRRAKSDGSYASANDPRVIVGLGASAEAPRLKVTWPSGRVEEFASVPIDRYTTLTEGSGK